MKWRLATNGNGDMTEAEGNFALTNAAGLQDVDNGQSAFGYLKAAASMPTVQKAKQ